VEKNIYRLKITIQWSEPQIWREVLMKKNSTFKNLHQLIQIIMEWDNAHLHEFPLDNHKYIGVKPKNSFGFSNKTCIKENNAELQDYLKKKGDTIEYLYDFGDNWQHIIELKEIKEIDDNKKYPICIDGENAAPIEDVGGIPGYYNMIEALNDTEHPQHEMYKEWMGENYDPTQFDKEKINKILIFLQR